MFKLSNVENKVQFELSVEGYEFPEDPHDDWCFVKVIIKQDDDTFEATDPALDTTELIGMFEWFSCLSERRLPRYSTLCFVEPCLEFEFLASTDDYLRISIHLNLELKPHFDLKQFNFPASNDWEIVFELDKNKTNEVLLGIKEVLVEYPVRSIT